MIYSVVETPWLFCVVPILFSLFFTLLSHLYLILECQSFFFHSVTSWRGGGEIEDSTLENGPITAYTSLA